MSGKLVVDALPSPAGMPLAGRRRVEDGAAIVGRWARAGDLVLTLGAGDVDRAARS